MLMPDDHVMAAQQATLAAERNEQIAALYRTDSRRILATLIRLLGDFDMAEEALHDAFTAALRGSTPPSRASPTSSKPPRPPQTRSRRTPCTASKMTACA